MKILKLALVTVWISGCGGGGNDSDVNTGETDPTAGSVVEPAGMAINNTDVAMVGDEVSTGDNSSAGDSEQVSVPVSSTDTDTDNVVVAENNPSDNDDAATAADEINTDDNSSAADSEQVGIPVNNTDPENIDVAENNPGDNDAANDDEQAVVQTNNTEPENTVVAEVVQDDSNAGIENEQSESINANSLVPNGVRFKAGTLERLGFKGDNWCQTWAADGSVITSMDDGDWFNDRFRYHNRLYKIDGGSRGFSVSDIENYPLFDVDGDGWFGYGVLSVNGVLYSMVSKTQSTNWSVGPFRGMKMLRSYDSGVTWHRVDRNNNERFLSPSDNARELLNAEEMFFFEESGRTGQGKAAYPFSYAAFVQNGRDHSASRDGYVYIYSPEGASTNQLLLARVPENLLGHRSEWEYFSGWNGESPTWSNNIEQRQANLVYPERSSNGDYFGWYSWLPSVVWNEGLGVYVMVSGGTYAGNGRTNSTEDYYNRWMHSKTGSLGLWYSANPYGPWTRFHYNEEWIVDDSKNLTYQPKLSPKWISEDGRTMTLIWSDAMRDAEGNSHTVNYKWNQMEIEITTE